MILATSTVVSLGSAKVSSVDAIPTALGSTQAPKLIYVDTFSISGASSKPKEDDSGGGLLGHRPHIFGGGGLFGGGDGDSGGGPLRQRREEQREETLDKLPGQMQRALVSDLRKSIAPAKAGDGSDGSGPRCWVITGRFVVVDTGNAAAQAGIGFGAGKSEIQVEAQVATVENSDSPFLTFDSQKASGHMPGAVVMHNPYVAVAKLVMSKKRPEKEAKKIAKSIAEEIGRFMAAHGIPTLKTAQTSTASESPQSADSSKGSRATD